MESPQPRSTALKALYSHIKKDTKTADKNIGIGASLYKLVQGFLAAGESEYL